MNQTRMLALVGATVLLLLSASVSADLWSDLRDAIRRGAEQQVDDTTAGSTPQTTGIGLLNPKTQSCRGRLGRGCGGPEDPLITRNPTRVVFPCEGNSQLLCVTSNMSMGSIKHDLCCDAQTSQGKDGWMCWGGRDKKREGNACKAEWDQALSDVAQAARFRHTWRYLVGDASSTDPHNWWFGVAPDGTKVGQHDPEADQISCHSNSVVASNGVWVCGSYLPTTVATTATATPAPPAATPAAAPPPRTGDYCLAGVCLGDRLSTIANLEWTSLRMRPRVRNYDVIVGVDAREFQAGYNRQRDEKKKASFLGSLDLVCESYTLHGTLDIGNRVAMTVGLGIDLRPGGWQGFEVTSIDRNYNLVSVSQTPGWEKLVLSRFPDAQNLTRPVITETQTGTRASSRPPAIEAVSPVTYSTGRPPTLRLTNNAFQRIRPTEDFRRHPGCPNNDQPLSLD